jgi:hypothetical protein
VKKEEDTMKVQFLAVIAAIVALTSTSLVQASFVTPKIGGGTLSASMIHITVGLTGTNVTAVVDTQYGTPNLVALTLPNSIDPASQYYVLESKAYNWQYAWNPASLVGVPAYDSIWMQRLSTTAGLQCYQRSTSVTDLSSLSLLPGIFGTGSSPLIWKWDGAMAHNAYAVFNPTLTQYTELYKVYVGNTSTGAVDGAFNSANVTLTWNATPVPEPATLMLLMGSALPLLARFRRRAR